MSLKGKRIIITGASKGLGLVASEALTREGARLVLMSRSIDKLQKAIGSYEVPHNHLAVAVDLLDCQQINDGIEKAVNFLQGVDAVLHCAGGGLGLKSTLLSSEELWKLLMTNVGAAAEINRLVVPIMKAQGVGNLVHVGSIASYESVGSVGYNTVKAALSAYVRSIGRELAPFNIVATGILPGGFIAPENAMQRLANSNPEAYDRFIEERLPRKRMGNADEIIPLLMLLCSEKASMMGGCMVPIDAAEGRVYF